MLLKKQLTTTTLRLGNTALHIAAYENNIEIVDKILLESACSSFDGNFSFNDLLGTRNKHEDTAVHVAAARGCLKYIVILFMSKLYTKQLHEVEGICG